MHPKCLKGKLSNLQFFGLIPDLENPEFELDFCSDSAKYAQIEECSSKALDVDGIQTDYRTNCMGKSDCSLDIKKYLK